MILFQVRLGCSGTFFRSTPKSLKNAGLRRGAEQDRVVNNIALQEETTTTGAEQVTTIWLVQPPPIETGFYLEVVTLEQLVKLWTT
jgi:hypothetical protein